MPSLKTVALAATLAATAAAYSTPLEARNDLDFSPDDLDVLFSRDVEIDNEDLELLARDLDITPEDMEVLFARSAKGGLLSSGIKAAESLFKFGKKHEKTISKVGNSAGTAAQYGGDAASSYQQYKGQKLQNQQTQIQNQQMASGSSGYRKRDLFEDDDELELIARDLGLEVEDLEILLPRVTKSLSKGLSLASKHQNTIRTGARQGASLANVGANLISTGQQLYGQHLQNKQTKLMNEQMSQGQGQGEAPQGNVRYRRDLFEEEDPEMWY